MRVMFNNKWGARDFAFLQNGLVRELLELKGVEG